MCVYSMIGDDFKGRIDNDEIWKKFVKREQSPYNQDGQKGIDNPAPDLPGFISVDLGLATKQELEILRREIQQLKELLKRAIKYDEQNNEPHCEVDAKIALIKAVAEALGIDLTEVLKHKTK